jgi:putative Mn2+ efflux pump MntP
MKLSRIKWHFLILVVTSFIGGALLNFVFDLNVLRTWTAWIPIVVFSILGVSVSTWLLRKQEQTEAEPHETMEQLRKRSVGPTDS